MRISGPLKEQYAKVNHVVITCEKVLYIIITAYLILGPPIGLQSTARLLPL